jgi:hypothetical protein
VCKDCGERPPQMAKKQSRMDSNLDNGNYKSLQWLRIFLRQGSTDVDKMTVNVNPHWSAGDFVRSQKGRPTWLFF